VHPPIITIPTRASANYQSLDCGCSMEQPYSSQVPDTPLFFYVLFSGSSGAAISL